MRKILLGLSFILMFSMSVFAVDSYEYSTKSDDTKWVKIDDNTWEYTLDVFDDEALFYAWEEFIPDGYDTDTDKNHYQIINDDNGNVKAVTVTNSKDLATLEISKVIDSENPLTEDESNIKFGFNISIEGLSGTQIINDVIFKEGKATIYLKHNEKFTLSGLAPNKNYTVTEIPNGDYPLETKVGDTGTLESGEVSHANFVNKKVDRTVEITNGFKLKKKISGGFAILSDKFNFMVSLSGLVPSRTYTYGSNTFTSDANGNAEVAVELGNNDIVEFTELPIGATYQVTELANEYIPSFTVIETSDNWTLIEKGQGGGNSNENLSTANEIVDENEDIIITFTNTKEAIIPNGIKNGIIVSILILGLVFIGLIYVQKSKKV